jgi:hypothetical protein
MVRLPARGSGRQVDAERVQELGGAAHVTDDDVDRIDPGGAHGDHGRSDEASALSTTPRSTRRLALQSRAIV